MDTIQQDVIHREVIVKAPKERVFKELANLDKLEGKFEVGESPSLVFEGYGSFQILITALEPYDYYAHRWVSHTEDGSIGFAGDVLASPNTLVEFRLSDADGGTLVQLTESGFASLPESIRSKTISDNTEGWDWTLDELVKSMTNE